MIAGALAPDAGGIRLGASLKMGCFAQQSLEVRDADLSVIEQLQRDFPQDGLGSLRTLAGAFQLSGDDIDKRIRSAFGWREVPARHGAGALQCAESAGARRSLRNHLDLATKEVLVEALKDFEGTMMFVSHDRTFLRGPRSRVSELGGDSGTDRTPLTYPGSYVEYVARRDTKRRECIAEA